MPGVKTWFGSGLDQDWVDSANGFWSVLLLSICSIGAFLARYVTEPIACFTPAQFEHEQINFAKQTCFMQERNYHPEYKIPLNAENKHYEYSYHLWIPMILFFQALCFKVPSIIWNTGKHCLTLNLHDTVESLKQAQITSTETRKSVFQDTARVLGKQLEGNKFLLAILYLLVKLLFCLNLLGQLIFLTVYFRNTLLMGAGSYLHFDIKSIIKPLLSKHIICAFDIRQLSTVYDYTVQCVLPITEIYEKMFVFLWYWVFLLAVVSFFNLLLWAGFLFLPFLRDRRISAYIKASPGSYHASPAITRFINGFLGIDGVLMLSMISRNSSEMVAADLSQHLYQVFLEKDHTYQSGPSTRPGESTGAPPPDMAVESVPMVTLTCYEGNPEKPPGLV